VKKRGRRGDDFVIKFFIKKSPLTSLLPRRGISERRLYGKDVK
jgi:hypothetical protein